METKELKIVAPDGYEIDRENSTLDRIRFKLIKKELTYKDIVTNIFLKNKKNLCFTDYRGEIIKGPCNNPSIERLTDKNNAFTEQQLKRILALNQLLNITEYYNNINKANNTQRYKITHDKPNGYYTCLHEVNYSIYGITPLFNKRSDAQAVIDNPNFREILDTIYKQ